MAIFYTLLGERTEEVEVPVSARDPEAGTVRVTFARLPLAEAHMLRAEVEAAERTLWRLSGQAERRERALRHHPPQDPHALHQEEEEIARLGQNGKAIARAAQEKALRRFVVGHATGDFATGLDPALLAQVQEAVPEEDPLRLALVHPASDGVMRVCVPFEGETWEDNAGRQRPGASARTVRLYQLAHPDLIDSLLDRALEFQRSATCKTPAEVWEAERVRASQAAARVKDRLAHLAQRLPALLAQGKSQAEAEAEALREAEDREKEGRLQALKEGDLGPFGVGGEAPATPMN